ncbi:SRPBCC family protein [Streptomyces sp. NPDC054933]
MASGTTFHIEVGMGLAVDPAAVFPYVSDLPRSGEWSPECRGGQWTSGRPAEVGSIFTARNYREADVVAWAPVVRGAWATECEVVESSAPRVFSWAIRDSAGNTQESVWSFRIQPTPNGSSLTHSFWMGKLTEGMRGILSGMSADEEQYFLADWANKIDRDMRCSLTRIKSALESAS